MRLQRVESILNVCEPWAVEVWVVPVCALPLGRSEGCAVGDAGGDDRPPKSVSLRPVRRVSPMLMSWRLMRGWRGICGVFLRANGIDARLDRVAVHQSQDWTLWMTDQVRNVGHILVIASLAYKRRAEAAIS